MTKVIRIFTYPVLGQRDGLFKSAIHRLDESAIAVNGGRGMYLAFQIRNIERRS